MATNTYVALSTQTLGSAVSSVTFSSIPQGYTDIRLVMSVKDSAGYGIIRYNGDGASTGLYSRTFMSGNGSTATSNRSVNANEHYYESSTTEFAVDTIDYMNYTNTNVLKTALARLNVAGARVDAVAYLYRSTSAISSITITSAGGNIQAGSTFTIYGIAAWTPETGTKAVGGVVSTDSTYCYHTFPFSGTFTPTQSLTADVLVVAGGGGGGGNGGGGGAGGLVYLASQSLSVSDYSVTVGAGGAYGVSSSYAATNGGNSSFGALGTAVGGGKGQTSNIGNTPGTGGSGGGANGPTSGGSGTSGQGYAGGNGYNGSEYGNGGGGGFTAAGANGTSTTGGNGGAGTSAYSSLGLATSTGHNVSGTVYYAGGGGGAVNNGTAGLGGLGGGGNATPTLSSGRPNAGIATSGGGGGGGGGSGATPNYAGESGGSGIVIVRYLK